MVKNIKYPVVYSYKKSRTRELELSIESLKNIKEWDGRIFIIGDKPDLIADYIHIPIKYSWGKESNVKSNDEICAYLTASDFLDYFIIMADDIYVLKKLKIEYFNRGTLDDHAASRHTNDSYIRQLIATKEYLKSNGKTNYSFEMHVPFLANSAQLKEMFAIAKESSPLFIRSLIGNWYGLKSKLSIDPKNKPITDNTVIYSSSDNTFNYDKVRKYLK